MFLLLLTSSKVRLVISATVNLVHANFPGVSVTFSFCPQVGEVKKALTSKQQAVQQAEQLQQSSQRELQQLQSQSEEALRDRASTQEALQEANSKV